MPQPITVSLGTEQFTVDSGDLTNDLFARFTHGSFRVLFDALRSAVTEPISAMPVEELKATLGTGTALNWMIGDVSLEFSPKIAGELSIRKSGEIFRLTEAQNDDDDASRQTFLVPPGKAYVTIGLRVRVGVTAASSFSHGALGLKASVSATDTFLLANHCQVDAGISVGAAIKTAFENFVLPLGEHAYHAVPNGNFLEQEFYGKLDVLVKPSIGFSGVSFGGMSGGDVRRCFASEIGSITAQAKPALDASAALQLRYQHEDAFRVVVSGGAASTRLYVFKMDSTKLSAALTATAGVSIDASVDIRPDMEVFMQKAAGKLFAGVQDESARKALTEKFIRRISGSQAAISEYIDEAERRIHDGVRKLTRLGVSAGLAFERISSHTTLLSLQFDKEAPVAGYRRAIGGDVVGALTEMGAALAPGSYSRSEISRTTTLSFQLFETFRAKSVQAYFEKSEVRYAGNGIFQMRLKTGLKAENEVFGHRKAIEFYFAVSAAATAKGAISDADINLCINTTEKNDVRAARRTGSMLQLLLRGTESDGLDYALLRAIATKPDIPVKVSLVFLASAYRRLRFSSPADPVNQTADALNYAAFVNAVDLIYAGSGMGTQGFPDSVDEYKNWTHYNLTAIDREDAQRPPNRRERGSGATDSVWPQDSVSFPAARASTATRRALRTFMLAAQQFMNFCEDLPKLGRNLEEAETREAIARVLDQATDLVKEGDGAFPLFFTKPLAAALVAQCGGIVKEVQAPSPAGASEGSFDVRLTIA